MQGESMSESVSMADLPAFSFHKNPVLIVENFWSLEERQFFREGMHQAAWRSLADLQQVREDFPQAGNWAKAEIGLVQGQRLLTRLQLPCIQAYHSGLHGVLSEYHRATRGFQLLLVRGWRLPVDP